MGQHPLSTDVLAPRFLCLTIQVKEMLGPQGATDLRVRGAQEQRHICPCPLAAATATGTLV